MNIIDLHNHTKFSYDGSNTPEEIIENAISHHVDIIGITDHQFSIRDDIMTYYHKLRTCQTKYQDQIKVLCGLEIGTRPKPNDLLVSTASLFDYVLFECLDSAIGMDLYEFLEWRRLFTCKVGLAHCDVFALSQRYGVNFLDIMKKEDIFWELNTSGHYDYYYDFATNEGKRAMVQKSGITISVGSDTHWIKEYDFDKLKRGNLLAKSLGNPIFEG